MRTNDKLRVDRTGRNVLSLDLVTVRSSGNSPLARAITLIKALRAIGIRLTVSVANNSQARAADAATVVVGPRE